MATATKRVTTKKTAPSEKPKAQARKRVPVKKGRATKAATPKQPTPAKKKPTPHVTPGVRAGRTRAYLALRYGRSFFADTGVAFWGRVQGN